jgi:hypothetical protein
MHHRRPGDCACIIASVSKQPVHSGWMGKTRQARAEKKLNLLATCREETEKERL